MDLIIGTVGAILILVSFMLSNLKYLSQESIVYDSMNFFGSVLLIIYAVLGKSYPFIVLNVIWALVSLKDIISYFRKPKTV